MYLIINCKDISRIDKFGVSIVLENLSIRIEHSYCMRQKKKKAKLHQKLFKSYNFSPRPGLIIMSWFLTKSIKVNFSTTNITITLGEHIYIYLT